MMLGVAGDLAVAKKKPESKATPKRYGTLIRVTDRFAEALRQAASIEQMSAAEYCDMHLIPVVEKRYRDFVLREAKKMEGKG